MEIFKIVIEGKGTTGQDRKKTDGQEVNFYDNGESTIDALAATLVRTFRENDVNVTDAKIVHMGNDMVDDSSDDVSDDLVTGIRSGNFKL